MSGAAGEEAPLPGEGRGSLPGPAAGSRVRPGPPAGRGTAGPLFREPRSWVPGAGGVAPGSPLRLGRPAAAPASPPPRGRRAAWRGRRGSPGEGGCAGGGQRGCRFLLRVHLASSARVSPPVGVCNQL